MRCHVVLSKEDMQIRINLIGGVLTAAICVSVIVLSFLSGVSVPSVVPYKDKGAHFLAYCAVGFSFYLWFFRFDEKKPFGFVGALLAGVLLGAIIEVLQPFFDRAFELVDLLMDAMGSLTGALVAALTCFLVKKHFH
jgi:VanZ family protein